MQFMHFALPYAAFLTVAPTVNRRDNIEGACPAEKPGSIEKLTAVLLCGDPQK